MARYGVDRREDHTDGLELYGPNHGAEIFATWLKRKLPITRGDFMGGWTLDPFQKNGSSERNIL